MSEVRLIYGTAGAQERTKMIPLIPALYRIMPLSGGAEPPVVDISVAGKVTITAYGTRTVLKATEPLSRFGEANVAIALAEAYAECNPRITERGFLVCSRTNKLANEMGIESRVNLPVGPEKPLLHQISLIHTAYSVMTMVVAEKKEEDGDPTDPIEWDWQTHFMPEMVDAIRKPALQIIGQLSVALQEACPPDITRHLRNASKQFEKLRENMRALKTDKPS